MLNPVSSCRSASIVLLALSAIALIGALSLQPSAPRHGVVTNAGAITVPPSGIAIAHVTPDVDPITIPQSQQGDRLNFFRDQRFTDESAEYPALRLYQESIAIRQRAMVNAASRSSRAVGDIVGWTNIGPGNIGGRTRAIIIDPVNTNTMYAVGVTGGIWKSTDAGANWIPTGDGMENLTFSALVMDPNDPLTLYAGGGEGVFPGDATRGAGIFKTTDGAQSWTLLTSSSNLTFVNKMVISPSDSNRIYAGARTGVWRSDDAGATWQVYLRNPVYISSGASASAGSTLLGCLDLAIRSDTAPGADTLIATFGSVFKDGVYRSVDSGANWSFFDTPSNQGRTSIAIAPSDNDVIYLSMADNGSVNDIGQLVSVFRSVDGGDTWQSRSDFAHPFGPWLLSNLALATGCIGGFPVYSQGWYDNAIAVDPTNPDAVWIAGIDLFKSIDGGQTFDLAAYWFTAETAPTYVHADKHTIVFHPDYGPSNKEMFIGSDGGIGHTFNADAATSSNDCPTSSFDPQPEIVWAELNSGYTVTQYYHGDAARTADVFVGGAQDNGTSKVSAVDTINNWSNIFGGDGGYVAIDPTNEDTIYAEIQFFPEIRKSTDGGATFDLAVNGITDTDGIFIVPIAMDQSNPEILWTGGHNPWRTVNGAALWENAGPIPADANQISAIAIAPSDSATVYLGYNNGKIYRSTNALDPSPAWTTISGPFGGGLPSNAWVSSIAVDPNDTDTAYCTLSTFGVAHVYQTTTGGSSWQRIDQALPDIPAHWIAIRECDSNQLYLGTELGVFVSDDAGATWTPGGMGLPNVIVESLDFRDENTLVAFTYGRGVYVSSLLACCPGDLNGDGIVDTADLGVLLGQFGTANSLADINGDGVVDTADLGILIGAFGTSCN